MDNAQVTEGMFTPERIEAANAETERLQRELDITNADHIALWLEANDPYEGDAWLACQIADAYDRAIARFNSYDRLVEALKRLSDERTLQTTIPEGPWTPEMVAEFQSKEVGHMRDLARAALGDAS